MSDHSHVLELVPLYALDALDAGEAAEVESHLGTCDDCRAELDLHRRVTTTLVEDVPAPAGVWDRIQTEISGASVEPTQVVDLGAARSRLRPAQWLMAAAAVVAFLFGGILLGQRLALNDLATDSGVISAANAAAADPESFVSEFFVDDVAVARVVLTKDGLGYIVPTDRLQPLGTDRTYQLWVLTPDELAISAGVLGNDPGPATFTWKGDLAGLALTTEVAGGVVSTEGDLVSVITDA